MARTTSSSVIGVLLDDYNSDPESGSAPSLTPFITAANLLTTRVSNYATEQSITVSDDELEVIERWLAAHFYAMSDRPYKEKQTEAAWATFVGETGKGLNFTPYGQMAMVLDPTGYLSSVDDGSSVLLQMGWLGKPRSEQIDYPDRD